MFVPLAFRFIFYFPLLVLVVVGLTIGHNGFSVFGGLKDLKQTDNLYFSLH